MAHGRSWTFLTRISQRKVARTTMEALNSGTETEFPLWRNRAVCRFRNSVSVPEFPNSRACRR